MNSFVKKALMFFSTGTVAVILAACYGTPVRDAYTAVVKAQTDDGSPIAGLEVVSSDGTYSDFTGTDGQVNVPLMVGESKQLTITDVDGEENLGSFESETIDLNSPDYQEITMKKAE